MSSMPMKTPLLDLLRDVPKDARGSWPTQWSDDGRETGHAMTPYGRLCHEAADQLKDLKAENARLREIIQRAVTDAENLPLNLPRDMLAEFREVLEGE